MTGLISRSLAVVLGTFLVTAMGTEALSSGTPSGGGRTDPPVLRRARVATGAERAPAVRALRIQAERIREPESAEPPKEELWWLVRPPSYFEQAVPAVTHTVDGKAFRMSRPAEERILRTAETATRWHSLEISLLFLCRIPATLDVEPRYVGIRTVEGITGDALEFVSASTSLAMLFDEKTHLPIAQVFRRLDGVTPSRVHRIGDFRRVDGVLYPFRIEERFGNYYSVTTIKAIEVNGRTQSSNR